MVPSYVAFILAFLSRSISGDRHYDCNKFLEKSGVAPRVDAQASSTRTSIGGLFPHLDTNGEVDRWISPWFSLEISREAFPWVYERGNKQGPADIYPGSVSCCGVDSDELIPPPRPRGGTGVFHCQRHHRFSLGEPRPAALALQLDWHMLVADDFLLESGGKKYCFCVGRASLMT